MDSPTKVEIENIFHVPFQNQGFVIEALTDKATNKHTYYERFEILGDCVLKTDSDMLGQIHNLVEANLDNKSSFGYVCVKNGLHPALAEKIRKYKEEASHQPPEYKAVSKPPKILADVVEALIAVVFYEKESFHTAWKVFMKLASPLITLDSPIIEVCDLCASSNRKMKFQRYGNTSLLFIDDVCFGATSHRDTKIANDVACKM